MILRKFHYLELFGNFILFTIAFSDRSFAFIYLNEILKTFYIHLIGLLDSYFSQFQPLQSSMTTPSFGIMQFTQSACSLENGSYFVKSEHKPQFFTITFLDNSCLCLLLQLRHAIIINYSLTKFTNNAFFISILLQHFLYSSVFFG